MRNLMLGVIGDFFSKTFKVIYIFVIVVCVILALALIMKYKGSRKIFFYVMSVVMVLCAIYCSVNFFKEINQEGYINGSLSLVNSKVQSEFYYSTNSIVFNEENNQFVYEKVFVRVQDFDGINNEYNVKLNNYLLFNSEISYGSVYSENDMDFLDTKGNLVKNVYFDLDIQFLSDKTVLKIITYSSEDVIYLEKYFSDFGFILNVYLVEV